VGAVIEYRAYTIGNDGRFISQRGFVCSNDADAVTWVNQLLDGHPIELWSGGALSVASNLSPREAQMEYKGIEYQVVQTANLTGWKWKVLDGRESGSGEGHSRTAAIALAQIAIDKLTKSVPDLPASL
jgi:hypothetical protein